MERHRRKALGAFYTDPAVVDFLVAWALPSPGGSVLDPSCGDGRFLKAASARGARRVEGTDLDEQAIAGACLTLGEGTVLRTADFFTVAPETAERFDAVVGNPPFVRYQRFSERSRRLALESALKVGVRLTRLTSSWAPFLLHAMQFLRPGGRMAMVVPAEITQTQYGLPTLRALLAHFAGVSLVSFEQNIFREAQTETLLLLAEGYGGRTPAARLVPLRSAGDLADCGQQVFEAHAGFDFSADQAGEVRFVEGHLTAAERRAWSAARQAPGVVRLDQLGVVSNGYVSGDNDFFHRRRADALASGLPAGWLIPTLRNSRSLIGLRVDAGDIRHLEAAAGAAHHLVVPEEGLFADAAALRQFLREGEARGTHERFKCRTRKPWWRVPGLVRPDLVLTYMSGARPRAAVNEAGAVFPNGLHGFRARPEVVPLAVAVAFHSSLTLLSLEIEGRSYGGGILKLEPSEMAAVRIPYPEGCARLAVLAAELDELFRAGDYDTAVHRVDAALLRDTLGFSTRRITELRSARQRLLERRVNRSRRRGIDGTSG